MDHRRKEVFLRKKCVFSFGDAMLYDLRLQRGPVQLITGSGRNNCQGSQKGIDGRKNENC